MPPQSTVGLTMADIYSPEYTVDPYPLFHRIRDVSPVFWDQRMGVDGAWMVTGYEAALAVFRNPKLSALRPQWNPNGPDALVRDEEFAGQLRALHSMMFTADPPAHTRLRRIARKPFVPAAVARMRGEIEAAAHELLDAVLPSGRMDYMEDFAMALPSTTMCRVLGIPVADRGLVWRRILSWGLVVDGGPLSKENPEYHLGKVGKYMDYFREQLGKRRVQRTDDLLQSLVDSWDEGEFISEEELLGNLMFLLTAGQVTTGHQIGNSTLALLAHPDVLATLRADPTRVPDATPELMRYDCSVQLTKRRAVEHMELAGQRIEQGQELFVWMGAANRDPEPFPDPDRLDPDRPKVQNLALGNGIHYCAGGQLGQLLNEVAVTVFAERVRNPRVDPAEVVRKPVPTFRGAHSIPMTFD
ncbi:cytochrome P450 [Actinophytocola sp.]|uniref:cytochrome P450 n=1 Tax=Actinophytocola sp. TaxID=1872138 RepID=UPI002ED23796